MILLVTVPNASRSLDSFPDRLSSSARISFRRVQAGDRLALPARLRRDYFPHPDDAGPF